MKNIHIIPTPQPSRLLKNTQYTTFWLRTDFLDREVKRGVEELQYQNICITSDEEIKEGDWFIEEGCELPIKAGYNKGLSENCKKIILTTDEQLIKEGVQAIDDKFLEWFVKNPTCERVEVEEVYFNGSGYYDANQLSEQEKKLYSSMKEYKIIIPKEEPKQEWSKSTGNIAVDYAIGQSKSIQKCMQLDAEMAYKSMPKQESIKEKIKEWYKYYNEVEVLSIFYSQKYSKLTEEINDFLKNEYNINNEYRLHGYSLNLKLIELKLKI